MRGLAAWTLAVTICAVAAVAAALALLAMPKQATEHPVTSAIA